MNKRKLTDGSGSVCHVDFYVISYVFGCSVLVLVVKDQTRSLDAACIVDPSPYTPNPEMVFGSGSERSHVL